MTIQILAAIAIGVLNVGLVYAMRFDRCWP